MIKSKILIGSLFFHKPERLKSNKYLVLELIFLIHVIIVVKLLR